MTIQQKFQNTKAAAIKGWRRFVFYSKLFIFLSIVCGLFYAGHWWGKNGLNEKIVQTATQVRADVSNIMSSKPAVTPVARLQLYPPKAEVANEVSTSSAAVEKWNPDQPLPSTLLWQSEQAVKKANHSKAKPSSSAVGHIKAGQKNLRRPGDNLPPSAFVVARSD